MQTLKILLLFTLAILIFYLPILSNPQSILQRGNDLQEYYWPVFYYAKQQILEQHTFPLWNSLFFSGTPLLTDPQSPLFYLPNIIFLILPIDSAFIASFVLHTLFAGLGAYWAARRGFQFSLHTSIVTGLLYLVLPRTAGFLETGHFGPFAFFTWLPFLVLSSVKLIKSPALGWSALFAISLTGLFFTFPTMFITAAVLISTTLLATGIYFLFKNRSHQTLLFLVIGIFTTFGLTAISFLPQLEWLAQTTRPILLNDPDVYPKWNSKIEFIKAIYPHISGGEQFINSLDNEKWIANGFFISLLALIGFLQIGTKFKLLIAMTASGIALISLNNASPIYSLLLSTDWYVLGRVSTRSWFVITLLVVFLAGAGFEKLSKRGFSKLAFFLAFLALGELLLLSWLRFQIPTPQQKEYAAAQVFDLLKQDKERFRVFCVNRCLSQKDVAKHNIETIEGYGTIYQKNYYDQFIQLSQVFWDKYSSVLPPFEIYNFREIQPIATELAAYNVKYVISPYPQKDKEFEFVKQVNNYLIYKNKIVRSRAYFSDGKEAPIISYSPNYMKVATSGHKAKELIIAEVYSPGWQAVLDGKKEVKIVETKSKLRQIDLEKDTQFAELYYTPKSYQTGKAVTLLTLAGLLTTFVYQQLKKERFLKHQKAKV